MALYVLTQKLKFSALYLTPATIDENAQTWSGVASNDMFTVSKVVSDIDNSYWDVSAAWFSQGTNGNFFLFNR